MMIKVVNIILLYISVTVVTLAAPTLVVELDKDQTEYGKPITATITASDIKQPVELLKLNEVRQNFHIEQKRYDKQASQQRLILKLVPRIQGSIVFPALKLAEVSSEIIPIKVTTGRVKGETIKLKMTQSYKKVWQRQQLLITLEVITSDQFASLKTRTPNLPGFKVIALKSGRQWKKVNGIRKTYLQTGWAIYPLLAGVQQLALPAITYHLGGVQKRSYYLPLIKLEVKKLPPYIPPTLPVGTVTLESSLGSDYVLGNNSLAFWNISLKSNEVMPQWFPAILRQVESTEGQKYFPVDSKRTLKKTENGIQSEVVHRIPFKLITSGRHTLAALGFQYFEPKSGRIINVTAADVSQISLSVLWMLLIGLSLFIVLSYVAYRIGSTFLNIVYKRQRIKKVLDELKQVVEIKRLRGLMREYAEIQQWSYNTTLREWYVNWCSHFKTDVAMQTLIETITKASYTRQYDEDISSLSFQLYQYLKYPTKKRKGLFS